MMTRFRALRSRRGLTAVEGALTLPVVMLAMAIGYELSSFVGNQSRVREVALRIADLAASDEGLAKTGRLTSIAEIRVAGQTMMTPLSVCDSAGFVLSGVTNADGKGAVIAWQEKWHYPTAKDAAGCVGVASNAMTSGLGAVGQAPKFSAVLPSQSIAAMSVKQRDSVVIAEVVMRDMKGVMTSVLKSALPTSQLGTGAARVRHEMP